MKLFFSFVFFIDTAKVHGNPSFFMQMEELLFSEKLYHAIMCTAVSVYESRGAGIDRLHDQCGEGTVNAIKEQSAQLVEQDTEQEHDNGKYEYNADEIRTLGVRRKIEVLPEEFPRVPLDTVQDDYNTG